MAANSSSSSLPPLPPGSTSTNNPEEQTILAILSSMSQKQALSTTARSTSPSTSRLPDLQSNPASPCHSDPSSILLPPLNAESSILYRTDPSLLSGTPSRPFHQESIWVEQQQPTVGAATAAVANGDSMEDDVDAEGGEVDEDEEEVEPKPVVRKGRKRSRSEDNDGGGANGGGKKEETWTRTRKDNHKEVERRRRETINDGINDLKKIVPGCEKNKGSILQRAVQYIQQLKDAEASNIEKWTLESLLLQQGMTELKNENDELKALVEENESLRGDNERLKNTIRLINAGNSGERGRER